jgi:outer membrane murein-binding lipoprotein Lpp
MRKTLTLVVLDGLVLAGCSGKQEAAQPAESVTALQSLLIPSRFQA